jgi:hypothetical protein
MRRTQKRYQYKIVKTALYTTGWLNSLGKRGWRLISIRALELIFEKEVIVTIRKNKP